MYLVLEHLPRMQKALHSLPSTEDKMKQSKTLRGMSSPRHLGGGGGGGWVGGGGHLSLGAWRACLGNIVILKNNKLGWGEAQWGNACCTSMGTGVWVLRTHIKMGMVLCACL